MRRPFSRLGDSATFGVLLRKVLMWRGVTRQAELGELVDCRERWKASLLPRAGTNAAPC